MARANPVTDERQSLYERDFYLWVEEQVRLLREGRLNELDVANLLEEVEWMGRSEKRAIKSNLIVVLVHLLKYQFQPDQRSSNWRGSIVEHRRRLRDDLKDSPSLHGYASEIFREAYEDAREQASVESGLPLRALPKASPYTLEQTLDPEFLPD
jgi:Domain of unknown function DUF29